MSPPMPRTSFRRNGTEAACEACRKRKSKCDHKRPACSYCARRKMHCYYHPAPMSTRIPPSRTTPSRLTPPSEKTPGSSSKQSYQAETPSSLLTPLTTNDPSTATSTPAAPLQSWPFTAESTAAALPQTFVSDLYEQKMRAQRMSTVRDILGSLQHVQRIRGIVDGYIAEARFTHVPRPVVKMLLDLLPVTARPDGVVELVGGLDKLAQDVFASSASPVDLGPDTTWQGFCQLFSGASLRVETVGLLCSLCAMAVLFDKRSRNTVDGEFVSEMLRWGKQSLDTARELAPQTNDVLLWLACSSTCLIDFLEGDTSLSVWRRMSEIAADMHALDIHRESSHSTELLPLFLSETRKRLFATVHHLDKTKAIAFSRPACVRLQNTDCVPPLDIPEDDLYSPTTPGEKLKLITMDGWSLQGTLGIMSAARVRFCFARFQEEILDIKDSTAPDRELKLRNISSRLRDSWDAMPVYVKYTPDCWDSISVGACLMLSFLCISYHNIQFTIFSMLRSDAAHTSSSAELVSAAWQILEVVLRVSKERNSGRLSTEDLPIVLLMYGVPSAVVLLDAMQQQQSDSSPEPALLPPEICKAALVRSLSVFISNLDTIADKTESNHFLAGHAAKHLSDRLDAVLEPPLSSGSRARSAVSYTPETSIASTELGQQDDNGLNDLPIMVFPGPMSVEEPEWTSWALLNLDYPMTSALV